MRVQSGAATYTVYIRFCNYASDILVKELKKKKIFKQLACSMNRTREVVCFDLMISAMRLK